MIRIQRGVNRDIWWVSPYDKEFHNIDSHDEPPSTQEDRMVVGNLQDALPPLLYERYCILKLVPSHEWVEGVGKIIKYNNGGCQVFIFEEE
jgi:hypothetical protein